MVLASLTVLAGILSGYFNRERVRLTRDIEALKGEKTALLETQKTIRQASADAKERLKELTEDYVRRDHQARQAYEELVAATLPGEDPEIIRKVAASFLPKGIPTPTPTPKQKK